VDAFIFRRPEPDNSCRILKPFYRKVLRRKGDALAAFLLMARLFLTAADCRPGAGYIVEVRAFGTLGIDPRPAPPGSQRCPAGHVHLGNYTTFSTFSVCLLLAATGSRNASWPSHRAGGTPRC